MKDDDEISSDAPTAVEEKKTRSTRRSKIAKLIEGDDAALPEAETETETVAAVSSTAETLVKTKPAKKSKKTKKSIFDGDDDFEYTSDEDTDGADGESDEKAKAAKKIKTRNRISKTKPTIDEILGFNYTAGNETFDFPFIDEPRWYRISVQSGSEAEMCETLRSKARSEWSHFLINASYPYGYSVRFKGKELVYTTKPLYATRMFVKMKMNPDYAEMIESIYGIYGFVKKRVLKTSKVVVMPLSQVDAEEVENILNLPRKVMEAKNLELKKDDYVRITEGNHKGKYGIVTGTRAGLFEVRLRSETQDEIVRVEMTQIEYLPNPPEKHYKELTPREAVMALMAKDPYSPTIRLLKKQGLLNQILYPQQSYNGQRERDQSAWSRSPRYDDAVGGTVKRIRSIGKPESTSSDAKPWMKSKEPSSSREYIPRSNNNDNNDKDNNRRNDRRFDDVSDFEINYDNFKIVPDDPVKKSREKASNNNAANLDRWVSHFI
jgi:transcription antitermination factor NusG